MNDLPDTLEQLSSRMNALEKRVRDLERASVNLEPSSPAASARPISDLPAAAPPSSPELSPAEQVSGAFLILGKAMLGIAGAYLLRALAEASVLPRLVIAAVAIAYAIGWLIAASRASTIPRFAGALYAATSAMILAPMLWELTMRFDVLPPAAAAGVLGVYVAAATILSWNKSRSPQFVVAYGAASLAALALSVVTHAMMPFLALLLTMVAVCEYRFIRTGGQGVRIFVAAVTDSAIWILIFIYRTPANTRADYPSLGPLILVLPACLMFALTASSVVYRTAVLRWRITAYAAMQSVITFLLWACSLLFLIPRFSGRIMGIICVLLAAACYTAAYGLFRPIAALRNFHVFALWSAALLMAGIYMSLPYGWAVACLAVASVAGAIVAARICCTTLQCHGMIYLTVAAMACGLLQYSFAALAGHMPYTVASNVLMVSASAVLCSIVLKEQEGAGWSLQLLHLVPALLAVCALAALAVQGALWLFALRITPQAFHVAFIRTLILCPFAFGLAFAGLRWRRLAMKRIAYALLIFVAAKLVFEDLRQGHLGFIAASIFLFALTLIGIPGLAKVAHRT